MKFTFLIGIIAYFVYNLHLLSIEDYPVFAVSVIAVFTGFAIGAMLTGARLDPTQQLSPIYYDPVSGGKLFIQSLMLFNIIGGIGFLTSLYLKKYSVKVESVSLIEIFAIMNFLISPVIIFLLRFGKVSGIPFNFIFLQPEIAFTIHMIIYLFFEEKNGYPLHTDILSLNFIDLETGTVIASHSPLKFNENIRLKGMAMIAIDQVVSMFSQDDTLDSTGYMGNYGDIIFIRKDKYLISAILTSGGKKMGRLALYFLLRSLLSEKLLDKENFVKAINRYLYSFNHKKFRVQSDGTYMFSGMKE